jgi:ankyrin repeat protein
MSTDRWWLSDNGDKIVFAIGDRAEAYPSRPCAPEEVVATTRDVAPAYEPQRPYQPVGFVFPSFNRCDHVHQPLHATAFAVLERFHDNAVERECSGAYFFVVGRNGRASFRMHVCGPDFIGIAQCRARAGEMWIEAEERFLYFGPSAHLSCLQCAVARSRYEPLFWEIMIGAATTVPPLGLRSSIGQRVPLHYAAYSEHIDQVRRILEAEADPNVQDAFGITPLEVAVGLNWVEAIQLLVGFGATGIAPMLHSVSQDDADSWNTTDETVEALLLLKADPNFPNARGQTPLFFSRFDADAVLLLCRAGADPSHADETGTTPLHLSVRRRRLGTVGHLLRHRADVNARTRRGVSPLMLAAGWEQGAELLRENGA